MPFLPVNCSATIERLAEEALDLAGPADDQLVFFAQFVDAEDGDDVLQIAVALEHRLHLAGDAGVLFADDVGGSRRAAGRGERIDGGVDALAGDAALEVDERVQVGEGVGRGGVGRIVGGDVHGLHRRDGAVLGAGDAFLQLAHFRGERRLVTDGAGHAAEQRRHFRTGLREAEDVVDEQQRVGAGFVAEVFGHRQGATGRREDARRAARSSGRRP